MNADDLERRVASGEAMPVILGDAITRVRELEAELAAKSAEAARMREALRKLLPYAERNFYSGDNLLIIERARAALTTAEGRT